MKNRTLRLVYREATQMLEAAGIENAKFEAAEIIAAALNRSGRDFLIKQADVIINEQRIAYIDRDLARRIDGEPLQYVLGQWEFYSRLIHTGKGVLVPRQDTEILVDRVLEEIADIERPEVLDLCAGSGCITVAIAGERPFAKVTAVELYDEAFGYLERNIDYHRFNINFGRIENQVTMRKYDVLTAPDSSFGKYDCIVSNPPYIQTDKLADLPREVKSEPVTALDGGADGCDFYRAIVANWAPLLKEGGFIAVEIGYDIAETVCGIFNAAGFNTEVTKDYNGCDRVVIAKK